MTFEEWFDRYIELFTDEDMPANDKLSVAWNGGYSYGIKAATEANAPKWISVEERLPAEGGRYWCFCRELNDLGLSTYQWNVGFNPQIGFVSEHTVTHWMELPPGPEQP